MLDVWSTMVCGPVLPTDNVKEQEMRKKAQEDIKAGHLDEQLILDLQSTPRSELVTFTPIHDREPLIEMNGVRVQYGDKVVLGDWTQKVKNKEIEGLSWLVRRGQRWAILGPNGSGKTTLLSLITSDHPQAYALPIKLFGRSRLPEPGKPAISLFELQSRLGHSSPEIHAFFPRQLTVRQAVESAYAETFLSKPKLDHDRDLDVNSVLRFFRPELDPNFDKAAENDPGAVFLNRRNFPHFAGKLRPFHPPEYEVEYADSFTFGELSTPQQRLVLFLRALVHRPDIIILDEPFSGMSASVRDKCIHFLEVGEHNSLVSTAIRRAGPRKSPARKALQNKYYDPVNLRAAGDLGTAGLGSGRPPNSAYESDGPRTNARHPIRYKGISQDQALIMVTHERHDIPDSVRHYMRLPSTHESDESGLDFGFGILKLMHILSDPEVWDVAWAPAEEFRKRRSSRNTRRVAPAKGQKVADIDENNFEYLSI